MARGFESKDVEFQQAEASRPPADPGPPLTPAEREAAAKRRTAELALSNARAQRSVAVNPHHQAMLDAAIAALESELKTLS